VASQFPFFEQADSPSYERRRGARKPRSRGAQWHFAAASDKG
jgi:hypothetical protein